MTIIPSIAQMMTISIPSIAIVVSQTIITITIGTDSMSAGDGDTLVVLTANGGRVDQGVVVGERKVVVGEGKVVVHQRCPSVVDKPGLGLGLSSSIGGDC